MSMSVVKHANNITINYTHSSLFASVYIVMTDVKLDTNKVTIKVN